MTPPDILEALHRHPLVGDGAMGTQLFAHGLDPSACCDLLSLEAPATVERVHRAYLAAGAQVIETNSFGANRAKLARYGLAEKMEAINRSAAALARRCAGDSAWVAGAMGPPGRPGPEPMETQEIEAMYAAQAVALAEGGVDLLILETFSDLPLLVRLLKVVKKAVALPVAAQLAFSATGRMQENLDPSDCFEALRLAGADMVGINCGVGPKGALDILRRSLFAGCPVSVFPNAGFPESVDDRLVYSSSPEYFARTVAEAVAHGARLLGGCCGTGPEHIAALAAILRAEKPGLGGRAATPIKPMIAPALSEETPSPFLAALGRRRMFLVELDPPRHLDTSPVLQAAQALAQAGVDAITVAENPLASPRLSNIALASAIAEHTGAQTIVHLTGRDRNLIGMQSVIMGLASRRLLNILAVTGDPPPAGGDEKVSGVYDVRSFELISLLEGFRNGRNAQGEDMKARPPFAIGAAFNPNTKDIRVQVARMKRKMECGARYFLTQPVYSREKIDLVLEATQEVGAPIFLGIMPLASHRNAEFLHNEFPGISISREVRERMREAGDNGAAEGIDIAWELMEYALPHFAGMYVIPPFNRYATALELHRRAKAGGFL